MDYEHVSNSFDTNTMYHSSKDFAERIAQLEQEGKKLMDATLHLGESMREQSSQDVMVSEDCNSSKQSVSHLVDITNEQNAISQISAQLEASTKEAQRLQSRLEHFDTAHNNYSNPRYASPTQAQALAAPHTYYPESPLERELSASRRELTEARTMMEELRKVNDQQREQFRQTISDAKAQLQDALVCKDNTAQLREQELKEHEIVVNKLKGMYSQLEQTNRLQEETLLELNSRLESREKDSYMTDSVICQLRTLIRDQETRRGRPYYETEPISTQSTSMLLHTLERCLNELHAEIATGKEKAAQYHGELELEKAAYEEKLALVKQDLEEKFDLIKLEHNEELKVTQDDLNNAKHETTRYQQQVLQLRAQLDHECRDRAEKESSLEQQLQQLRTQYEQESAEWTVKRSSLEGALDETQHEISALRCKWEETAKKYGEIKTKIDNTQKSMGRVNTDLELERDQRQKWEQEYEALMKRCEQLHEQVRMKEQELHEAKQSYKSLQIQCQAELEQTMDSMKRKQDEVTNTQLSSLTNQMSSLSRQYEDVVLDLDNLKVKHNDLHMQHQTLNMECKELAIKEEEKVKHINMLNEELTIKQAKMEQQQKKLSELEVKLEQEKREKSYHAKVVEDQTNQITELKGDLDKATSKARDYEMKLQDLQSQHQALKTETEQYNTDNDKLQEQCDALRSDLAGTEAELVSHKTQLLEATDKLQESNKQMKAIEDDNVQLADAVTQLREEIQTQSLDNQQLQHQVEELSLKTQSVTLERDHIQQQSHHREEEMTADVKKMAHKLKHAEHERKLARKALKLQENVDGKAIRVAGKMQREVTEKRGTIDTLQTRINWLEECLEVALKEKKQLDDELVALRQGSSTAERQNGSSKKDKQDITRLQQANQNLTEKLSMLQLTLDKANVKNSEYQAKLEQQQQEMARQQLRHQLQIKELSRVSLSAIDGPYKSSFSNLLEAGGQGLMQGSASSVPALLQPTQQGTTHVQGQSTVRSHTPSSDNQSCVTGGSSENRPTLTPPAAAVSSGSVYESQQQTRDLVVAPASAIAESLHHGHVDLPVSQKPTQGQLEQLASENAVGSELRKLLDEMKDLVSHQKKVASSQELATTTTHPHSSSSSVGPAAPGRGEEQGWDEAGVAQHTAYRPSYLVEYQSKDMQQPTNKHITVEQIQKILRQAERDTHVRDDMYSSGAPTSVPTPTMLAAPTQKDCDHLQHPHAYNSRVQLAKNTQALCERLESKIQNLAKMGNQLHHGNQEVTKLVADQDRKLKEARRAEKHFTG